MTADVREVAIRYRANILARRELREALGPLLVAARPLGWITVARLTHLPRATVQRLAASCVLPDDDANPPPPPLLNRATLTRLARAGRRLAKLQAEQRSQRAVLGEAIRAMRARGVGWHVISNSLGGRAGESTAWVVVLAREPAGTANRRPRGPMPEDHRQAIALGRDSTTLTLLRISDPTPGVRALLSQRLERYPALTPERVVRIAGIPPPARGGGDTS